MADIKLNSIEDAVKDFQEGKFVSLQPSVGIYILTTEPTLKYFCIDKQIIRNIIIDCR